MDKYVWVASVAWQSGAPSSILGAFSTEENAKDACDDESADGLSEIEWQSYFDVLFIGFGGSDKYVVERFELDAS